MANLVHLAVAISNSLRALALPTIYALCVAVSKRRTSRLLRGESLAEIDNERTTSSLCRAAAVAQQQQQRTTTTHRLTSLCVAGRAAHRRHCSMTGRQKYRCVGEQRAGMHRCNARRHSDREDRERLGTALRPHMTRQRTVPPTQLALSSFASPTRHCFVIVSPVHCNPPRRITQFMASGDDYCSS